MYKYNKFRYQNFNRNVAALLEDYIVNAGMMSNEDIREAIENNEIIITPFEIKDSNVYNLKQIYGEIDEKNRLNPASFNFSFSRFIVSLNKKSFFKIYEEIIKEDEDKDKSKDFNDLCIYVNPGDTAISLTNESIWVSKSIAGMFHSKVGFVCQGLGHISTTLDPGWQGQLLISVNNPSNKKKRVLIGRIHKKERTIIYNTFITLCLFRLITPAIGKSNNHSGRIDTLRKIIINNDNKCFMNFNFQRKMERILADLITFEKDLGTTILSDYEPISEYNKKLFISDYNKYLEKLDAQYDEIESINCKKRILHLIIAFVLWLAIIFIFILIIIIYQMNKNLPSLITTLILFGNLSVLAAKPLVKFTKDNIKK